MKKIFSKIIIGTLVAGFFLAPVSVAVRNTNGNVALEIEDKKAYAFMTSLEVLTLKPADIDLPNGQVTITIKITGKPGSTEVVRVCLKLAASLNAPACLVDAPIVINTNLSEQTIKVVVPYAYVADTEYRVNAYVSPSDSGVNVLSNIVTFTGDGSKVDQSVNGVTGASLTGGDYSFNCGPGFKAFGFEIDVGTISGCVAGLFYINWWIVSMVMHLGGLFLDFFVYYSTDSKSYKGLFVERGWAVVRDVANLFFIIALLYVAFKVILNDTHSNAKKLVGMVIIMALLINFSLFATRVVIDASNILAKIFYNNITSRNANGQLTNNPEGEKSISVGLVQKFNPQTIISKDRYDSKNGVYEFIFTTFILILVTGYCAYVFFSVALLFVARVVSLWIAMIFSPIAFASNTISKDIGTLGWKKWSSELINNAMLAPIFIFFLYLIVLFLDATGDAITYTGSEGLFKNIMATIIPFMVLVGLLKKAKSITKEYAGEMGKTVQGMGAAIGGLALGGAALGGAALGRNIIGRTSAKLAQGDNAVQYGKDKAKHQFELDAWNKRDAKQIKDDRLAGKTKPVFVPTAKVDGKDYTWREKMGGSINAAQIRVSKAEHAQHDWAELKKKSGAEGKPDNRLGGIEMETMAKNFGTDKKSEFEANVRKGTDGTDIIYLDKSKGIKGEDEFKAANRKEVEESLLSKATTDADGNNINANGKSNLENSIASGDVKQTKTEIERVDLATGKTVKEEVLEHTITKQGEERLKDELKIKLDAAVKVALKAETDKKFEKLKLSANEKVSFGEQVQAKQTSGSFDVRKIDKLVSGKLGGLGTKATVGLISAVAMGIRMGMKSGKVQTGDSKGDLFKDIGETVSNALKGVSINLPSGGGGDHGHDKPSGGAAGHGADDHH